MSRSACVLFAFSMPLLLALPGCGNGRHPWEITLENRSDVPCSVFVTLGADGNSNAKVENFEKGKTIILISGNSSTIVQSIKVVRGKDEQTLTPKARLEVFKRYAIVVGADGKVETSISDKR